MTHSTLYSLFVFALLSSPISFAEESQEARHIEAIERLHDRRVQVFNKGDVEGFMEQVTDDVLFMPMDAPTSSGREALRRFYRSWFGSTDIRLQNFIDEIELFGEYAYVRGRVTISETPKSGGTTTTDERKWVEILKLGPDGEWRFWRAIWNSNKP